MTAIYANDNVGAWRSEFSRVVETCRKRAGPARKPVELLAPESGDIALLQPRSRSWPAC